MKLPMPEWKLISEHPNVFQDGERYLVALRVHSTRRPVRWEFYKIQVEADETINLIHADESEVLGEKVNFTEWNFEDFEFYIKLDDSSDNVERGGDEHHNAQNS